MCHSVPVPLVCHVRASLLYLFAIQLALGEAGVDYDCAV